MRASIGFMRPSGAPGKLSRQSEVAKAMNYMLKRWDSFTRFLADGRICLTNKRRRARSARHRARTQVVACSAAPIAAVNAPPSCIR
jgi:hypothetical protein